MKNVIVFAVGHQRYAIELRWVREVVTLGHVTSVPTAPAAIAGAVNIRGAVTPVIELTDALLDPAKPLLTTDASEASVQRSAARKGSGGLLVEANGMSAAIHMTTVETVTTLRHVGKHADSNADTNTNVHLSDGSGGEIELIHVPMLLEATMEQVANARDSPRSIDGT